MMSEASVIFISGRFRSGSSFIWQLFDQLPGFCAWYEPLHPQLLAAIEHTKPKADHVGVQDYWSTYRELPAFSETYRPTFATEQLYLEPEADAVALKAYIDHLIELSAPRIPVLQFNRMDLRLWWLKSEFPKALLIHTDRNPLQLYHSQRRHIDEAVRHEANYWDAYELMPWCWSLAETFPFLLNPHHPHAFFRCYLLHRMSSIMASRHADLRINLDQHVFESDEFIERLASVVHFSRAEQQHLASLAHVPDVPVFDDRLTAELAAIMTEVDVLLNASGLDEFLGARPLTVIRQQHPDFWQRQAGLNQQHVWQLLNQMNSHQAEMTRILAENEALKTQLDARSADQPEPTTDHE